VEVIDSSWHVECHSTCVHDHCIVSLQCVECSCSICVHSWLQVTAIDIDPSKEQEAKKLGAEK
jgi:hypothetical protein